MRMPWKRSLMLFIQRFWQPTCACMTAMPGSLGQLLNSTHWAIALQTGLATGLLALLIALLPIGRLYDQRVGNALLVGLLTMGGDAFAHARRGAIDLGEVVVTGAISGALALLLPWLIEGPVARFRRTWPTRP